MRYLDLFDTRSDAWLHGDVVLSRTPGPLVLTPGRRATLSGAVAHPRVLHECTVRVSATFASDAGRLIIAVAQPHEWGATEEAPLRIAFTRRGEITVLDAAGDVVATVLQAESAAEVRSLIFHRRDGQLILQGPDGEVPVPWPGRSEEGGFLSLLAEGTTVTVHRVGVMSPLTRPPLTSEQRRADHDAWLRARMNANTAQVTALRETVRDETARLRWGFRCDVAVAPGLVAPSEPVRVTFRVDGDLPEENAATVEADYLGAQPCAPQPLALDWTRDGAGWRAEVVLTPDVPGNWRVAWQVGPERLTRIFGVLAPGYAVCTLWVGNNKPDIDHLIHRYELPGDYWVGNWWSPFTGSPSAVLDYLLPYAGFRHRYGDRLVPFVNADWLLPGVPNFNLSAVPEAIQAEGLGLVASLWELLGVGPLEILGSYTFGNATPHLAQRVGAKAINSLCIWQNWLDGSDANGWKIDHWGAPNAPYFVAADDFRKVGAPGIVGFSMGTASPVRNYSIYTMEGCPTLTEPLRRYTDTPAQAANLARFTDAVDGWLASAASAPTPFFFTVALENFVRSRDWEAANAGAVTALVERAARGGLLFASAADIADYYRAHYAVQPEHVFYWPDLYCGYRADAKPAQLPDRIEMSSAECFTLHEDGTALPRCFWNYTTFWDEPAWDDAAEYRDAHGLMQPEAIPPLASTPRQVDLGETAVTVTIAHTETGVELLLDITAPLPTALLPVAVWRVPLTADAVAQTPEHTRWTSAVDPYTGNLHGIVTCANVPAGASTRRVSLSGTPRAPQSADFALGETIRGRSFVLTEPHCYLWRADGAPAGAFTLLADRPLRVRYNDGTESAAAPGVPLTITFDDTWAHECPCVFGITGAEMEGVWEYAAG
jgi:hypothetical protein